MPRVSQVLVDFDESSDAVAPHVAIPTTDTSSRYVDHASAFSQILVACETDNRVGR